MANYIAWYGKKRERLQAVERHFDRMLKDESQRAMIGKQAELVRLAHIRALRSRRAELRPTESNADAFTNLDWCIAFWEHLSPEAVISGYRDGTLRGQAAMNRWLRRIKQGRAVHEWD